MASECNQLLQRAPSDEYARLAPYLETIALPAGSVIYEPRTTNTHVYFPQSGMISIVAGSDEGGAEASIVGRSGFLGLAVLFGAKHSVHRSIAQASGTAKRITASAFMRELADAPVFRALTHRYAYARLETTARTVACNTLHTVEPRCARWLLMVSDEAERKPFDLTQAFLAQMLGVRRAGVTNVLGALQSAGFVEYSRGRIKVLDRPALKQIACSCYRVMRNISKELFA